MSIKRRTFLKGCASAGAALGLSRGLTAPASAAESASPQDRPAWRGTSAPMPRELEADMVARQAIEGGTDPLAAHRKVIADNMEPVIAHDDQLAQAREKLAALEKKTGKKPNILIFLVDNMGYGDLGINGGGLLSGAPTPNMDRLGREGLHLLSTYSQPSCTPTRCSLLTGRLPMRHGQLRPSFAGEPGGLGKETTVAKALSDNGYVTQAIGKWHCGENEESQPQNVGFDDFYGFLGWSGLYTDWQDPEFAPEFALSPERQALVREVPFNDHIVHGVKGKGLEDLEQITLEVSSQLDEKFADYSEQFIRKMADSDQPFFLYHCFRALHVKNYVNPKYKGKSPAKYPYKDCLVEVDDIVGRLAAALEETGQLENTLIFVTSDNGPMLEPWPDAGWSPFRGGIATTWEGGTRVPGIAYWKGMIAPGRESDGLFDLHDLFLTSLALAGVDYRPPKDRYLDSIDQTSFLLIDDGLSNRKYTYYWSQDVMCALRVAEYKFVMYGMSDDDWDVVNPSSSTTLEYYKNAKLYNLYLDPKERYSFYGRQTFMDNLFSDPWYAHKATYVKYPEKTAKSG